MFFFVFFVALFFVSLLVFLHNGDLVPDEKGEGWQRMGGRDGNISRLPFFYVMMVGGGLDG